MDVFVNLTDDKPLAEMWPHLLAQQDGRIIPWQPRNTLSRVFGEPILMLLLLMMLLLASILPALIPILREPALDVQAMREQVLPALAVRGIVTACAFFLITLRTRLIDLFSDYRFARLLQVKTDLVAYWSNFAVCRFTGYERGDSFLTPNAVILIGGLSSTIVLALAGIYVWHEQILNIRTYTGSVAVTAVFWFFMAYIHGTLAWSFTVIPVYLFRGLKNVPMRIDDHGGEISEFWLVERAGRYAAGGVAIVTAGAIALSVLPVFITPFRELSMALTWAQGALIVCFSVLVLRFRIWSQPDALKRIVGAIEVLGMLLLFVAARVAIGVAGESGLILDAARWLRLGEPELIKRYAELTLFSLIAGYLFYCLGGTSCAGRYGRRTKRTGSGGMRTILIRL